jgi:hypothetical protein
MRIAARLGPGGSGLTGEVEEMHGRARIFQYTLRRMGKVCVSINFIAQIKLYFI